MRVRMVSMKALGCVGQRPGDEHSRTVAPLAAHGFGSFRDDPV